MSFNDTTNRNGKHNFKSDEQDVYSENEQNQIDTDDIQNENNIEDENGTLDLQQNPKKKLQNVGMSNEKQTASGQANRIGAFKKSIMDNDKVKTRDRQSPYRGLRRETDVNGGSDSKFSNHLAKEDTIEDGSSPSRYLKSQNQELEARQAVMGLNEAGEVLAVVSKFEQNFYQTKNKINGLDMISLESDITAQILNTCFQIVHDCIQQDNSAFDKENIEGKIQQLHDKVKTSSLEYNQYKGEFFAVNEPVINKNIHIFKLDRVQGYAQRQDEIIEKIPNHEEIIKDQSQQLQNLKKNYQTFEMSLFKGKLQETNVVLKDTEKLISTIQQQQGKLKQVTEQANQSFLFIVAQTKEQKLKKQKIQSDIYQVEKKLDLSLQALSSETNKKEVYNEKHQECEQIVSNTQKASALIDMINNSRKLQKLVENYKKWYEMYKRLKEILEEQIQTAEFELQKAIQESKKFQDQIQNEKKDEYDDVLRKIQKLGKKIQDDADEQKKRLDNFDKKIVQPQATNQNITDQDMIFLKKEIVRNSSALISAKAMTQEITDHSVLVRDKSIQSPQGITLNDLQQLNSNYLILQKQDEVDIPRVKVNIDLLEGYCIKSLKSQLNEDNKKSQTQISKMKKNYEDLQKLIDQLNQKIGKIAQQINILKEQFQNDDYERENDIFNKLEDKLDLCEKDVNGERNESAQNVGPGEDSILNQKIQSLQARKKNIIAFINKMVNQFNENNKLIKEANKNTKNEKEIGELIQKNKEIEQDCQKIEEKIQSSKDFASEITGRLDSLLNPTIQDIKDQYAQKNQLIDDCDENFEKVNAAMKKIEDQLAEKIGKLQKVMAKLNTVSPLNTPSNPDKANDKFMKLVNEKTDNAHELRGDLEDKQEKLAQTRNYLLNLVQPLNELGERIVPQNDIDHILKELLDLLNDLLELEKSLQPTYNQLDTLQEEVDFMLENDKTNKLNQADNLLQNLDIKIEEISVARDDAYQKLNEYKNLLQEAKQSDNKDDPELILQLKGHENDAKQKEKELGELDARWNDLKKKRNESKKLLEDMNKSINKFTPQQIEGLIAAILEQIEKCGDLNQRYQEIEMEIVEAIRSLKDLLENSSLRKALSKEADETQKQLQEDLDALKNILDQLPKQVDLVLLTLKEMKTGSEPDKDADYWEERKFIDKEIAAMTQIKDNLAQLQKSFLKKNSEFQQLSQNMKQKGDLHLFKNLLDELKELSNEVQDILNSAYDARDEVAQIRKDMSDCQIPVNIQMRKNELHGFQERLDNIKIDFKEMKQADERFQGNTNSENEIKALIQQIEAKLKQFDQESRDIHKFQQFTLEGYKEQDFFGLQNQKIIEEVRQFKQTIADVTERLKDLQSIIDDLNLKLMQQDMDNASVILQKKIINLRERLRAADKSLKKIVKCGEQMDGNTTQQEEDEFIDALRDEMPEVFKNVDINFIHIDDTEKLLKQVLETKSIEKMIFLKKEIEEVTNKVEQSESLVIKLENEIIEWNALRKVCRRDEELQEIDSLCKEFKEDLSSEEVLMGKEFQKVSQKLEKDGEQTGEIHDIFQGLKSYLTELSDLLKVVNNLQQDRDQCFQEFDSDVPKPIKEDRIKRINNDAQNSPNGKKSTQSLRSLKNQTESDKPTDKYYLIEINCKYKRRIHEMLKNLRHINQRRKDLEDKYSLLKNQLNFQPGLPKAAPKSAFKAIKGDAVDELFFFHLQKAGCTLNVKRLGPGKYLFGTKNIMAKIINGKLVIRVGGGYMSADEFIEQYGKMEMLKMMRQEELNQGIENSNVMGAVGAGRQSGKLLGGATSMGDMKAMLRQSLLGQIKTYDEGQSGTKVSKEGVNIKDIEGKYEMARIGGNKSPAQRQTKIEGSPKRNNDPLSRTLTSNDKGQNSARFGSPKIQRK